MLRSLYISMIYGAFLCAGFVAPFALGLGYVWVDNFTPQKVAYSILTEIPVSQVMAVAAIGAYVLFDRKHPPRFTVVTVLSIMMLFYVTYTTFDNPVAPEFAESKWNWAAKTILFSLFMPAMFRSRVQIEAFLQVYVFSLAAQFVPFAAKTLISGGSYGTSFGIVAGNSGLAEGSTLSTVCMMAGLFCLHLARFQTILPQWRAVRIGFVVMFFACMVASVGTYERTALIGMAVVLGSLWLRSGHKALWALGAGAVGLFSLSYLMTSDSEWYQRMMTIGDTHESSSLGRLLVWQWTLDFVRDHPFGGGFYSYVVNVITFPTSPDVPEALVFHGKAFHSVYFEMLGENGWPGLALFLGLVAASVNMLLGVRRRCRKLPGTEWCADLALSVITCLALLLICGAFISIAFQPEMYYTFALAVMLRQYVRGVEARVLDDGLRAAERDDRRREERDAIYGDAAWA